MSKEEREKNKESAITAESPGVKIPLHFGYNKDHDAVIIAILPTVQITLPYELFKQGYHGVTNQRKSAKSGGLVTLSSSIADLNGKKLKGM